MANRFMVIANQTMSLIGVGLLAGIFHRLDGAKSILSAVPWFVLLRLAFGLAFPWYCSRPVVDDIASLKDPRILSTSPTLRKF